MTRVGLSVFMFLSMLFIVTLSGCNKGELNKNPSEKQTSMTTPIMTNDTQKDLTDEDLHFLNASAPAEMKLTSYIKNNIDNSNNNDEILVTYGTDEVKIKKILIFYRIEGKLEPQVELKNSIESIGGITTYTELLNLKGNNAKQIVLDVEVESNGNIKEIYEILNNKANMIFSFGTGDDKLGAVIKDIDNDGIDEIIENISYNDYQQHLIQTTKKWDGEKFGTINKAVSYKNETGKFKQPTSPVDVVRCYIELVILGIQSNEIELLVENGASNAINSLDFSKYFDEGRLFYGFDYDLQEASTEYADGIHYSVYIPNSDIEVEVREIGSRLMITGFNENMYQ